MPLAPRRVLKQFKYAMYFNGVNAYVEIAHSDSLNLNVLTVMAWFRSTYPGAWARTIVAKYGYDYITNMWILGWMDVNTLGFVIRDVNGVINKASAGYGEGLDDSWHLVAGVASESFVQFWMDGTLKSNVSRTAGDIRNTRPAILGMHVYLYVPEQIAQVLIYSRALSDSEIMWNYNNTDNPIRNGLILWLKADPAYVKDIDNDGVLEWIDLSGFGNHGKIYGAQLVQLIKTPARTLIPARVLKAVR